MGCDIELFVERRAGFGKPWEPVAVKSACSSRHPDGAKGCHWCRGTGLEIGYNTRSYLTFSHLAGVRNYEDVIPIDKPRGLPDDMSELLQRVSRDYLSTDECDAITEEYGESWLGDHSHSWLTLTELDAHNWGEAKHTHFVEVFLPALRELGDPMNVRIVFGFDS